MAKKFNAKYVAYLAIFTALSTIANIFTITFAADIGVSLMYVPCVLAGIFLGMPAGFIVGLLGDLLGCLIHPLGPWMPLFTLSSALVGVIAGLVVHIWRKFDPECLEKLLSRNAIIWVIMIMITIICSWGLNTTNLFIVYAANKGKLFFAYLGGRIPTSLIVTAVNGVILTVLLNIPAVRNFLKRTFSIKAFN